MREYGRDVGDQADGTAVDSVDQATLSRRLEQAENLKVDQSLSDAGSEPAAVQGFEQSGLAKSQDVQRYLVETFPPEHVDKASLESVQYCDVYKPSQGGNILGMTEYNPETDVSKIEIYRQDANGCHDGSSMAYTIAHEVGHNAYWVSGESTQQAWDQTSMASAPDEYVTQYARTGVREDFAESYANYVHDPDLLHEVSPTKYNFMRSHIFHGREYR